MNDFANNIPLLTLLIAVPTIGALAIGVLPKESDHAAKLFATIASVITGLLSVVLVIAFDRHKGDYQFVSHHMWFSAFGVQWKLGVDGISLFLVVLSGLVFPLAILAAKVKESQRAFFRMDFVARGRLHRRIHCARLFLFFVFFEVVLVPMYFLIGGWGLERRGYAALKFFLYTFVGSAFMFVGMIALGLHHCKQNRQATYVRHSDDHYSCRGVTHSSALAVCGFCDCIRRQDPTVSSAYMAARCLRTIAIYWCDHLGRRNGQSSELMD